MSQHFFSLLYCSECPFKGKLCPAEKLIARKEMRRGKLCTPAKVALCLAEEMSEISGVAGDMLETDEIINRALRRISGKVEIKDKN